MPLNRKPSRRLKLDDEPFNQLPVITADKDGTVEVLRGPFDITTLSLRNRRALEGNPGKPHTVFTNRLGDHLVYAEGTLLEIGQDLTKIGQSGFTGRHYWDAETLPELAALIRKDGERLIKYADKFDAAAADGWILTRHGEEYTWWDLEDTKEGPDFSTRPRK